MKPHPDGSGKALESGENSRAKGNPNASEIIPDSRHLWAMSGKQSHAPAPYPGTPAPSTEVNPVDETERRYSKNDLARYLRVSVRTLNRIAARGDLPPADLTIGRNARWLPQTVATWLRSKPQLSARKGAGHG